MTSKKELEKAVIKSFILLCVNFGKFSDCYTLEAIENLEQASYKLTQFCRALKLKLSEKLDAPDEGGEL